VAKVTAPLGSGEARGKVGAYVYGTWRGISVVRSLVTPKNEFTTRRVASQTLLSTVAKQWKLQSDECRQEWHDFANKHVFPDWTGADLRLPAWNWWVKIQYLRNFLGLAPSIWPPPFDSLYTFHELSANDDYPTIDVYWTPWMPGDDLDYVAQIFVTHALSPGRQPTLHDAHYHTNVSCHVNQAFITVPETGTYTVFLRPVNVWGMPGNWQSARVTLTE
jgi:hypothetical protein